MKVQEIEKLHTTKWLQLKQASCLTHDGKKFKWDYISRSNGQKIVILLCRSKNRKKILLLKEYRVPFQKWIVEFPKGMINKNEPIKRAALRELEEETGYKGKIIQIHPFMTTSAYLTDETCAIVEIEVDEENLGNINHDIAEEIKPFWVKPEEFYKKVMELEKDEFILESNVWFFFKNLN